MTQLFVEVVRELDEDYLAWQRDEASKKTVR